jgi:FkbM family methyltransferase
MTACSHLYYLIWRATGGRWDLRVRFRSGVRLILRGGKVDDLNTGHEIFVREAYRPPESLKPDEILRVVDVGANVGYSAIYWASLFRNAAIEAFEPNPEILPALRANLELNGLTDRVKIFPVAAGTKNATALLTDAGVCSSLTEDRSKSGYEVTVKDFFEAVGSGRIDLLKMDCEGSEYDLIADSRFANLNVIFLVLEWHATEHRPNAKREVFEMLSRQRWGIKPVSETGTADRTFGLINTGIAWAFRKNYSQALPASRDWSER